MKKYTGPDQDHNKQNIPSVAVYRKYQAIIFFWLKLVLLHWIVLGCPPFCHGTATLLAVATGTEELQIVFMISTTF